MRVFFNSNRLSSWAKREKTLNDTLEEVSRSNSRHLSSLFVPGGGEKKRGCDFKIYFLTIIIVIMVIQEHITENWVIMGKYK